LKLENRALLSKNESLNEATWSHEIERDELESQLNKITETQEKVRKELSARIEKAYLQLEDINDLRDENQELKDKIGRLKEALDSSVAKNTVLSVKMEEVEATMPFIQNLEVEAELLRKEVKSSSSERDMLRVQCAVKEDENLRLRQALKEAKACALENEKLQKEMAYLREDNLRLTDQLEAKENHLLPMSPQHVLTVFEPNEILCEQDSNQGRVKNKDETQWPAKGFVSSPESDITGEEQKDKKPPVKEKELSTKDFRGSCSSNYDEVRAHASKMLNWAEKQLITNKSSKSVASSIVSSMGTDFLPTTKNGVHTTSDLMKQASMLPPEHIECPSPQIVISNIKQVGSQTKCCFQGTSFSDNREHVEFYLPKLGMGCSCGKCPQGDYTSENEDPMALENILRPWQVDFLKSQTLSTAVEFVHAFNQRGGILAKAMRKWRKEQKMISIKTKSCGIALHIWSRTCKAVARSVRKQMAEGVAKPERPKFLEVSPDDLSMSTLGCGSMIEFGTEEEM